MQYNFLHHFVQIRMRICFGSRRLKVLLFSFCVKLYVVNALGDVFRGEKMYSVSVVGRGNVFVYLK